MWAIIIFIFDILVVLYTAHYTENMHISGEEKAALEGALVILVFLIIGIFIWFGFDIPDKFEKTTNEFKHLFFRTTIRTKKIKGKIMEILKKFKNFFLLNARDKRLLKLGITDDNNELTAEGEKIYNLWRFDRDRDEFDKEVAQKLEKK